MHNFNSPTSPTYLSTKVGGELSGCLGWPTHLGLFMYLPIWVGI